MQVDDRRPPAGPFTALMELRAAIRAADRRYRHLERRLDAYGSRLYATRARLEREGYLDRPAPPGRRSAPKHDPRPRRASDKPLEVVIARAVHGEVRRCRWGPAARVRL